MSNSKFHLDKNAIHLLKECNELAWRMSGRVEELFNDLHGTSVPRSVRDEIEILEQYLNKVINQTTEALDADREIDGECVHAYCPNPTNIEAYGLKVERYLPSNWEVSDITPDTVYIRGHNTCRTDGEREFEHYLQPRLTSGLIHSVLATAEEVAKRAQGERDNLEDGWVQTNDIRHQLPC